MQNLTSTGAEEALSTVENASEHTTKVGEAEMVLTDFLKVENSDIGYVDASNTNANVTGGSSTSDDNKVGNKHSNTGSVAASNTNANVSGGSSQSNNQGGHPRGNKKDGPAKNVEAERRRREKLNKRFLELRSVVPKMSQMDDQPSILEDTIDYLRKLRQKVSTLERELQLPPAANPPVATRFSQLTQTAASIPSCSTKDLVPIREPATVDVQQIGKGVLDIHIVCSPNQALLYLISKTLNDHGLTIRNAMISCFDSFKLDFQAQQINEGQYVNPDEIKVILLNLVGDHGAPEV